MTKPTKGKVPPQLRGHQFTKGTSMPKAMGKMGGKMSPAKAMTGKGGKVTAKSKSK